MIVEHQRNRDPKGTLEYWRCPHCGLEKSINEKTVTLPIDEQGIVRCQHECGTYCVPYMKTWRGSRCLERSYRAANFLKVKL